DALTGRTDDVASGPSTAAVVGRLMRREIAAGIDTRPVILRSLKYDRAGAASFLTDEWADAESPQDRICDLVYGLTALATPRAIIRLRDIRQRAGRAAAQASAALELLGAE